VPRLASVYAAYQALVLGLTWPAVARLTTHGIGGADKGGYDHLWFVWWVKQAVWTDEKLAHTTFIRYPEGYDTFDTFHNVMHEVIEQPLHLVLPIVGVYNVVILVAMALAGLFAYLCARLYVDDRPACFVTGVFFLAAPVIWGALNNGESELSNYYWVPLDFWLLHRMCERRTWPWAVATGLALALSCLGSWYFGVEMALFALLFVAVRTIQSARADGLRTGGRQLAVGALAAGICCAVLAPHVVTLRDHLHEGFIFLEDIPNLEHFFWPGIATPEAAIGGEQRSGEVNFYEIYYIGWVLIGLAVVGFIAVRLRDRRLLLVMALLFFSFSLGEFLHTANQPHTIPGWIVPMPMALLYKLRFFRGIHKAFRWIVLVRLLLGILAAGGLARLAGSGGPRRWAVHGAALAIYLLEFAFLGIQPATMPMETFPAHESTISQVYQTIADDPDDVAVLELPATLHLNHMSRYLFWQTFHGKRLVGPVAPHYPQRIGDAVVQQYGELDLLYREAGQRRGAAGPYQQAARQQIRDTGVRYVVYHPEFEGPLVQVEMDLDSIRAAAVSREAADDGTELWVLY
jgi:hypothetical protein